MKPTDGPRWQAAVRRAQLKAILDARSSLGLKDGTVWSEQCSGALRLRAQDPVQ